MTVLYLSNNPQLAGTARILLSWLTLGRQDGLGGCVVVQRPGQLSAWLQAEGVPWTTSEMPWPERRWPVPALREAWRVARWARAARTTLVHCNEHDTYPFGVFVARFLRAPIVCHVRFQIDRGFGQWAFSGWRRPDALLWTSNQQRLDSADATEGIVPQAKQHLVPLGPDRAEFRFDAAERLEARRRYGVRDDEIAVGMATALRPIKRIGDFVDLVCSLAGSNPRVVGLLAGGVVPGETAYAQEMERRIAASGLGRRLRWLGHLEPIGPFLRSLDIFVSTSEYETFGNSVAEAMACRLPVAAYVGGSVQEVIGGAGVVVPNGDLKALTEAVGRLVGDPGARERYGRLAEERVASEFNPVASFRKLSRIYAALAKSRPDS